MKNSSYVLDIIVPHYKEPLEIVQKFFSMLDIQRGVDFDSFRVILVNDGEENAFPDSYFESLPYPFRQISIPHSGVSAARNAGLDAAQAHTCYTVTVRQLYDDSLCVYVNAINPYQERQYYSLPDRK